MASFSEFEDYSREKSLDDHVIPDTEAISVTDDNEDVPDTSSNIVESIPLCTTEVFDENNLASSVAYPKDIDAQKDVLSGFTFDEIIWKGKPELGVKFIENVPEDWVCEGRGMNVTNIISWANKWSDRGHDVIPKFVDVGCRKAPAEIRVLFNSERKTETKVGNRAAKVKDDAPTMWLDLNSAISVHDKQYIVVHEFGHALGLLHEHQRSDFWKNIKPYIDMDKMRKDLNVTDDKFERDWDSINPEEKRDTKYDPDSVMHYRFKKEWLKDEYKDESNVKSDVFLTGAEKTALLAVHKQSKCIINEPSKLDIKLLKRLYGDDSVMDSDIDELDTDSGQGEIMSEEKDGLPQVSQIAAPGGHNLEHMKMEPSSRPKVPRLMKSDTHGQVYVDLALHLPTPTPHVGYSIPSTEQSLLDSAASASPPFQPPITQAGVQQPNIYTSATGASSYASSGPIQSSVSNVAPTSAVSAQQPTTSHSLTSSTGKDPVEDSEEDPEMLPNDSIWNERPTIGNLTILKWYDSKKKRQILRLYQDLQPYWENIARTLDIAASVIKAIEMKNQDDRLREVLTKWLQNGSNLPQAKQYPVSWQGFIQLLFDVEQGDKAIVLKKALSADRSNIRNTF